MSKTDREFLKNIQTALANGASWCFRDHLTAIRLAAIIETVPADQETPVDYTYQKVEPVELPVARLRLRTQVLSCLYQNDVFRVGQLCQHTERELLMFPNLGKKALVEIKEGLARVGMTLA